MLRRRQRVLTGALLALAVVSVAAAPAKASEAEVGYSRSAGTLLVSFREIYPEFADQDPTPLIRIYGDGRVVVHLSAYLKRNGVYQMWLPKHELDALLVELAPVLLAFEENEVRAARQEAAAALRAAAKGSGGPTLFGVADAEVSVFHLNLDSYRPAGPGAAIALPPFERVWQGLRHDAERYPGLEPIQDLMRAEGALRALALRPELAWVGPAAPSP